MNFSTFSKRIVFAASLLLVCGALTPTPAISATPIDKSDARIADALQSLQRFSSLRSLNDLQEAIFALTSAIDIRAIRRSDLLAKRRQIVGAWGRIFKAIEASTDPAFDLSNRNNIPDDCVTPPMQADGRQLPSCAAPADVTDPVARAKYIAAINANDLKKQRAAYQARLRYLDGGAMSSLQMELSIFRRVAPGNAPELMTILRGEGLSSARLAKIQAMM